jgi:hypothetical protein
LKNCVFWDVTPCGSCKNRRFGGSYRLHQQGDKSGWTRNSVSCNWQPTHLLSSSGWPRTMFRSLELSSSITGQSP